MSGNNEKISDTVVSKALADIINEMKKQLQKDYGCDFAFVVLGNGRMLSASNQRYGNISPKSN